MTWEQNTPLNTIGMDKLRMGPKSNKKSPDLERLGTKSL